MSSHPQKWHLSIICHPPICCCWYPTWSHLKLLWVPCISKYDLQTTEMLSLSLFNQLIQLLCMYTDTSCELGMSFLLALDLITIRQFQNIALFATTSAYLCALALQDLGFQLNNTWSSQTTNWAMACSTPKCVNSSLPSSLAWPLPFWLAFSSCICFQSACVLWSNAAKIQTLLSFLLFSYLPSHAQPSHTMPPSIVWTSPLYLKAASSYDDSIVLLLLWLIPRIPRLGCCIIVSSTITITLVSVVDPSLVFFLTLQIHECYNKDLHGLILFILMVYSHPPLFETHWSMRQSCFLSPNLVQFPPFLFYCIHTPCK